MSTSFTYQGQLQKDGTAVNGTCDLALTLYDAATSGTQVGVSQVIANLAVNHGLFTTVVDFGVAFHSEARWLGIQARCPASSGVFVTLEPRQMVSAVPFALALPGLHTEMSLTSPSVVGGYGGNSLGAVVGATISGGGSADGSYGNGVNHVLGDFGTVSGGAGNYAGGDAHSSGKTHATVGGGYSNVAKGDSSTVAGGETNTASNLDTAVGGGTNNQASGPRATVGGGYVNVASGNASTVPGGANNLAQGGYSFAAGGAAQATHEGSFVWSSAESTASWAPQTFTARAHGGVRFYTASGTGTGVQVPGGSGSWSSLSDRAAKEHVSPVDGREVLGRLAALPVATWSYRTQDAAIRHIGPMAQDFRAAFGVGEDSRFISNVDADGVALAAIQGLTLELQDRDSRIAALEARLAELEQVVTRLETRSREH